MCIRDSASPARSAPDLQCKRIGYSAVSNAFTKSRIMIGFGAPRLSTLKNKSFRPVSYTHLDVYKRQELFYAQEGSGAFKNQSQIFASETTSLESAKMLGDRHMFHSKKWPIKWPDFKVEQRNSIAYRIALVASGEFDGAIATTPKNDWDIAAGAIIAKEANAKFTDHLGNDFRFNQETPLQRSLVVSNSNIFNDILGHLSHIV